MNLTVDKLPAGIATRAFGANVAIGLFCIVLIAAMWLFTLGQVRFERDQEIEHAFTGNADLAIAFEETTTRVLKSAEQTLRLIGQEYARQGARLDVQKMIDGGLIDTDILSFAGVMDERGRLILGSPEFKPIDVADREYFQFHQRRATAEMYVGMPMLGRVRNKWVVPLVRRINKPDGAFGGVAYASLDLAYFNRLFEQANLGEQGLAMLVGLDGITRARRSGQTTSSGQDMRGSTLFAEQRTHPSGNYASAGKLEGVPRFISYRTLTQYPLIVAVGTSQAVTLAEAHARERKYYAAAALASGVIVLLGWGLMFALSRQRRGVEALYSSNARFGVAFNQAAVGIARTGLDGRFLEVNRKLCDMLGYSQDELQKRTFIEITHPDDRQLSRNFRASLLAGRSEHAFPALEKRYLRKDGSTIWAIVNIALVRDMSGSPNYTMSVIQDITERQIAERLLADSERRFRALVENAADAVVITDRNGVITYASPAIKLIGGYELAEFVGRNFLEFVHPEDVQASRATFEELRRDVGKQRNAERRFRHKDGSWIVLDMIAKNALDDPTIQGIIVNARDETKRKQAEHALLRVNRALKALSSCNGILIRAEQEMQLVQKMCDNIVEVGGYRLAWVGIVEHDAKKTVRPMAYAGYDEGFIEQAHVTWADTEYGRGPVGTAIRARQPHVIHDVHTDPSFQLWRNNAVKLGYGSILALPLIAADEVLGALVIYAAEINMFDGEEMKLLGELADDLAFGISTLRTRAAHERGAARLQRSMEGTILAMAATLEMRDAYTAGHQRHVAELSTAIARELGLAQDEVHGIYLAAIVHDLGKIQIPAEILSKPTRLTKIEYEMIKIHPEAGYNILKEVEFPWPIAQMVYQHHERLDGSGYPRGLKEAEILLGAKILAVADTVEAMSSHRPYRAGLGIDKALEEVMKNRATTYDADVVDACVILFREKRFAFST